MPWLDDGLGSWNFGLVGVGQTRGEGIAIRSSEYLEPPVQNLAKHGHERECGCSFVEHPKSIRGVSQWWGALSFRRGSSTASEKAGRCLIIISGRISEGTINYGQDLETYLEMHRVFVNG